MKRILLQVSGSRKLLRPAPEQCFAWFCMSFYMVLYGFNYVLLTTGLLDATIFDSVQAWATSTSPLSHGSGSSELRIGQLEALQVDDLKPYAAHLKPSRHQGDSAEGHAPPDGVLLERRQRAQAVDDVQLLQHLEVEGVA